MKSNISANLVARHQYDQPTMKYSLEALIVFSVCLCFGGCRTPEPNNTGTKEALISRAASFELNTKSISPPGDPQEHHASGFAKILCSEKIDKYYE